MLNRGTSSPARVPRVSARDKQQAQGGGVRIEGNVAGVVGRTWCCQWVIGGGRRSAVGGQFSGECANDRLGGRHWERGKETQKERE